MARIIKLTCPYGHDWEEDLDQAQSWQSTYKGVFRGDKPRTRTETYYFRCRKCGAEVAVDVEIQE